MLRVHSKAKAEQYTIDYKCWCSEQSGRSSGGQGLARVTVRSGQGRPLPLDVLASGAGESEIQPPSISTRVHDTTTYSTSKCKARAERTQSGPACK